MAKSATIWTREQRLAIDTVDRSVLVSAAAGSGKTSVLAERCAHLVCDAPPPHRCDVTELLVVTFTEAAAAEMRTRIAGALHERFLQSDDERLAKQLALIDRAQISTIHSFCSRIIRQHFHLLGIDPNFQMIAEEEGTLLRSEIAREVFANHYEHDPDGAFGRLIDRYGDGRDESLRNRVIHTHALLGSLADPKQWMDKSRQRLRDAAEKPLKQSALGVALLKRIGRDLALIRDRLVRVITQLQSYPKMSKYESYATEVLAHAESWIDGFRTGGVDELAHRAKEVFVDQVRGAPKLSPEEVAVKDELYAARDAMKKGDIFNLCQFSEAEWRDGMASTIEPAELLLNLVEEFGRRYQEAKSELRVLDFDDLEQFALRVLQESPAAARTYRDQFKHVLVDEYQDVNQLQDRILTLVSRENAENGDAPNFFCVGDIKQSIYRFRLADPETFQAREKSLRSSGARGTVIDLQTNFRSREPLLATLNAMFQRLMTEEAAEITYDETHHLRAPDDSPYLAHAVSTPHVELRLLPKASRDDSDDGEDATSTNDDEAEQLDQTEREAAYVAMRINQLIGRDGSTPATVLARDGARPAKLSDIAILLRSMKFKSEQFADVLRGNGIAVHSDTGSGFFASTEVQDVLALLKVLDNGRQDIPLAALLRSPIASIAHPEDALAKIRLAYPSRDVPFHQAVQNYARAKRDDLAARLRDLLHLLADWRELATRRPLAEVLWRIYDRSGYLAFCEGLDDGDQRVANLLSLFERARQFGSFRKQGLSRFMRFLDTLRDEVDDVGQPSVASEADDAVRIMSVHRSKGLEFPIVFLPDLGKRHNLSDSRGHVFVDRVAGIGLSVVDETRRIRYPSLASAIVSERMKKQSLAEEMRVLYVATTRARERLILVGTCGDDALEKWTRRWSSHEGALPSDEVLRGGCMLDWIGPALTAARSANLSFDVEPVDPAPLEAAATDARATLTDHQQHLAALQPLRSSISAADSARAAEVWKRLTDAYPFHAFTIERASMAVTALSHAGEPSVPTTNAQLRERETFAPDHLLRRPRIDVATAADISAADVGAATHTVFQHLDLARPCSRDDLLAQVESMIAKKQLPAAWGAAVNVDSLAWFINDTELGRLLRERSSDLLREAPINFPLTCDSSNDPMDRVMVRGRIDALLPVPAKSPLKAIVIDLKTDRVEAGPALDARVVAYQKQIVSYAGAVRGMLGCDAVETHLVFLDPRVVKSAAI